VTSATQGSTGLAERYATALFELAEAEKAVDIIDAELQQIAQAITASPDLARLIRSPVISRTDQRKGIDAVLQSAGASPLTRKFAGLLARNRRLFALPSIIAAYSQRLADRRGETSAEVVSAKPLTEDQLAQIASVLKRSVGRQVAVAPRVDPSLLGGLVVKVGSRMVDSSLKTKLLRLSLAIKGIA